MARSLALLASKNNDEEESLDILRLVGCSENEDV